MKTLVNGIEVKTVADLEKAMQWENQNGEYATVVYIAENKQDWKKFAPMSYREFQNIYMLKLSEENAKNVCNYQFIRNWYNENQECLKSYNDGFAYDKELSIKYNVSKLAKELNIKNC